MTESPETPEETEAETEAPAPPPMAYGVLATSSFGDVVLHPSREQLVETVTQMKADGWISVLDVCGVDYLSHSGRSLPAGIAPERFELVVTLISHQERRRVRLRVQVPADDPVVPSLFDLYPGTEAPERETYDMFGIVFDGHPDMTRILMPDGWDGHPLRKDFAVGSVPVQFKAAPSGS